MDVPEGLEEILRETTNKCDRNKKLLNLVLETSRKLLKQLEDEKQKLCRIQKELYGLKQSGRQRYKQLDLELNEIGVKSLNADPCTYTSSREGKDSTRVDTTLSSRQITING